ncbi:hypothetical protein Goklo_021486, partial [Gossypium klotzschianum]|nr:hypothetical protein [Gossypium klotzschianum]
MKCAALTTHRIGVLEEKMMGRVTELHHFTHSHKLVLANCNDPVYETTCRICKLQILGPAYFCPLRYCRYILHESCLRLPQKIRVPFHPSHMLVSRLLPTHQRCYACTLGLHLEDDSEKYYRDFCEEERNPNDDIYHCEECNGQTIAHIECVLAEVEDNIEIRKNNQEERFRKEDMLIGFASDLIEHWVVLIMFQPLTAARKFECTAPIEEVIQAGVVPRFVECRDLVLGHGALLPLLALLNEPVSRSMLRIAAWTLSRFCKPPSDQVKLVLPRLARLIHSNDEVVLAKVCWALSYLFDGTNGKIQVVIEAGVLGRLVELVMHPSPSVIAPTLHRVRHIVTGDDVQIQAVIEATIIASLLHLLQNADL